MTCRTLRKNVHADFKKFNWEQFSRAKSADDVAYQMYQQFIVIDDLIEFNALDSTNAEARALTADMEQLKIDQMGGFLAKLNDCLKTVNDDSDEDDLDSDLRVAMPDLYRNLYGIFVQNAFSIAAEENPEITQQFNMVYQAQMMINQEAQKGEQANQEQIKALQQRLAEANAKLSELANPYGDPLRKYMGVNGSLKRLSALNSEDENMARTVQFMGYLGL